MTTKRCLQRIEQVKPLFSKSGEIAANTAKGSGSLFTAEGAGDFLLDLDHPQIPFGQIVVKGGMQIQQESQHLRFAGEQAIQKIALSTLFGSSAFAWRRQRPWREDQQRPGGKFPQEKDHQQAQKRSDALPGASKPGLVYC